MKFSYLFIFCACVLLVKSQQKKCNTRSGKNGTCMDLYACSSVMAIVKTTTTYLQLFLIFREYSCSLRANKPRVCCPSTQTNSYSIEPPDVGNHPNLNLLPYECGVSQTQEKISNGIKTHIFELPWMARLLYDTLEGPIFDCGATVLNENYLLTAAHCIRRHGDQLIGARVGDHDYSKDKDCELDEENVEICLPPPQNLAIEEMIPHPEYNRKTKKNDIGLLRVSRIDFSNKAVSTICMPLEKTRNYNFTNKYATVSGWGLTSKQKPSPVLLKVSLPVVPLGQCGHYFPLLAAIDYTQLCAGGKAPSDSCLSDSGGPLESVNIVNNDARHVQHGIISFGLHNTCGQENLGVYTKVAYYMNWILDTIQP